MTDPQDTPTRLGRPVSAAGPMRRYMIGFGDELAAWLRALGDGNTSKGVRRAGDCAKWLEGGDDG